MVVLSLNQINSVVGLVVATGTLPADGAYHVTVDSTIVPPSGLSIVVEQGEDTIATSSTPTAVDQVAHVSVEVSGLAGDVITITLSSTNLNDAPKNNIKSTINIQAV